MGGIAGHKSQHPRAIQECLQIGEGGLPKWISVALIWCILPRDVRTGKLSANYWVVRIKPLKSENLFAWLRRNSVAQSESTS